jgi:VanZ family protein
LSEIDHDPDPEQGGARRRPGFFVHVVPALLYVFAVFYGGSIGMSTASSIGILSHDKLMHALAFGGMQLVVLRAVRFELPRLGAVRQNLASLAAVSAIGALLELYQMALPHRSAELLDWVADTLGALSVAGFVELARRRRRRADS